MAEITGDSPQAVAFALLERIAFAEKWSAQATGQIWVKSRKETLDTYKECIEAVLGEYSKWGPYS
jgi:hypothetical protein